MGSKLDLPHATKAGSIVSVTWDECPETEQGTYEGRVLGIKGHKVTIEVWVDREPETFVIDLKTGRDLLYHGVVSDIVLKMPS